MSFSSVPDLAKLNVFLNRVDIVVLGFSRRGEVSWSGLSEAKGDGIVHNATVISVGLEF